MKKSLLLAFIFFTYNASAQDRTELIKHFENYYQQMKTQGDAQGIINGLTHLNLLSPSEARADTLAYVYMRESKFIQALNTIGTESSESDSNLGLEVKAFSLKAINQPALAIIHFEEMFKRSPNVDIAYELAELHMSLNNLPEANKHIDFGLMNATNDQKKAFFETQQPYEVSLKSAFLYLKGLVTFNENKSENIDAAITIFDEALVLEPNFNLAKISKAALVSQKNQKTNSED